MAEQAIEATKEALGLTGWGTKDGEEHPLTLRSQPWLLGSICVLQLKSVPAQAQVFQPKSVSVAWLGGLRLNPLCCTRALSAFLSSVRFANVRHRHFYLVSAHAQRWPATIAPPRYQPRAFRKVVVFNAVIAIWSSHRFSCASGGAGQVAARERPGEDAPLPEGEGRSVRRCENRKGPPWSTETCGTYGRCGGGVVHHEAEKSEGKSKSGDDNRPADSLLQEGISVPVVFLLPACRRTVMACVYAVPARSSAHYT